MKIDAFLFFSPSKRVFLLSLKAASLGLNLTAANRKKEKKIYCFVCLFVFSDWFCCFLFFCNVVSAVFVLTVDISVFFSFGFELVGCFVLYLFVKGFVLFVVLISL
jgi:hypothetical protein